MDLSDSLLTKIETYFDDKMSTEERDSFEQELNDNPELARELSNYADGRKAIEVFSEKQLKKRLTKRYQKADNTAKVRRFPRYSWIAVAASICFLVVTSLWYFNRNETFSNDELYAAYYESTSLSGIRDSDEEFPQLNTAKEAFENRQYEQAIDLLNPLVQDSLFNRKPFAYLHIGIGYLELQNPEEAVNALNMIPQTSGFIWKAKWYRALALLKLNKTSEAKILFEDISTGSNEFGNKSKEILKKISN